MNSLRRLARMVRRWWFAAHGCQLESDCILRAGVSLECGVRNALKGEIVVARGSELQRGACLHAWGGRIRVGENVFLGPYAVVYGHGGVEIGADTLVAMHCRIMSSNHSVPAPGVLIRSQPDVLLPTRIGRDVWLGAGVTVLGGVSIGDGCVVGAGAVVTHDLPPNTVCHGVPAQVIRMRQ